MTHSVYGFVTNCSIGTLEILFIIIIRIKIGQVLPAKFHLDRHRCEFTFPKTLKIWNFTNINGSTLHDSYKIYWVYAHNNSCILCCGNLFTEMPMFSDGICCDSVKAGDEPIPDCSAAAWSGCRVGLLLRHPSQRILSAPDDPAFLPAAVPQQYVDPY